MIDRDKKTKKNRRILCTLLLYLFKIRNIFNGTAHAS